ncbi:MAG: hypothetical protein KBD64_05265 [Gammaproteobacteria bacterium]|nr:hypothetical protein [Gammaproteobacteria bacterium]
MSYFVAIDSYAVTWTQTPSRYCSEVDTPGNGGQIKNSVKNSTEECTAEAISMLNPGASMYAPNSSTQLYSPGYFVNSISAQNTGGKIDCQNMTAYCRTWQPSFPGSATRPSSIYLTSQNNLELLTVGEPWLYGITVNLGNSAFNDPGVTQSAMGQLPPGLILGRPVSPNINNWVTGTPTQPGFWSVAYNVNNVSGGFSAEPLNFVAFHNYLVQAQPKSVSTLQPASPVPTLTLGFVNPPVPLSLFFDIPASCANNVTYTSTNLPNWLSIQGGNLVVNVITPPTSNPSITINASCNGTSVSTTIPPSGATPTPTSAPAPTSNGICGNGAIDGSEQCDLGSSFNNGANGCNSDCTVQKTGGTWQCSNDITKYNLFITSNDPDSLKSLYTQLTAPIPISGVQNLTPPSDNRISNFVAEHVCAGNTTSSGVAQSGVAQGWESACAQYQKDILRFKQLNLNNSIKTAFGAVAPMPDCSTIINLMDTSTNPVGVFKINCDPVLGSIN